MIFQLLSLGEGAYMIGVVGTYLGKWVTGPTFKTFHLVILLLLLLFSASSLSSTIPDVLRASGSVLISSAMSCISRAVVLLIQRVKVGSLEESTYFYVKRLEFFVLLFVLIFSFYLVELGFELRSLCLQSKNLITWAIPATYFVLVILEMRSQELFSRTGLTSILQISASQVVRISGVSQQYLFAVQGIELRELHMLG
jgi:hypothetical protein